MLRDLYRGSNIRVEVKDREGLHHVRRNSLRTAWQNHVRIAREKVRDSTAFVVGAAGFEPTTCSTQNCRATRLRYTPIIWETTSIHA
jgi:hypothetical protein